jgi:hypothetical protein
MSTPKVSALRLSVEEYDRLEAAAIPRLSYPAIRSFCPAAFNAAHFPSRVTSEEELIRYCDIMNELEDADRYYRKALYSKREAALMLRTCQTVEKITTEMYDRPTQPFMCLFPPFDIVRTVVSIAPSRVTVLEIGPGSGILGSYLIQLGYRYFAVDNTQALYLWQNRLFSALARNNFADYAAASALPRNIIASVAHIPWWLFAEAYKAPLQADIIVCDGVMSGMETFGLYYLIHMAAAMASKTPHLCFLYRGVGEPRFTSQATIEQIFASAGFVRQQYGSVVIQSLKQLTVPKAPPPLGGHSELTSADKFLHIDDDKLLDSYSFFDFMELGSALSTLQRC